MASTGLRLSSLTFLIRTASCSNTADRGLPGSSVPQRSSVARTAGNPVQSSPEPPVCRMVNSVLRTRASARACANAFSLAAEKSDGWNTELTNGVFGAGVSPMMRNPLDIGDKQ